MTSESRHEAFLSIAAGRAQLPLIHAARGLGLAIVAVDRDEGAPGMELADERIPVSAREPERVLEALRARRRAGKARIAAVGTKSSGLPVLTAARVAGELGCRGLDPTFALRAISKPGLRELAREAGVPFPRGIACLSVGDVERSGLGLPLVVKPARTLVGKRGISRVDRREDLVPRFREAAAASPGGVVEVEELIEGGDVVLAVLFHGGSSLPLALFDELAGFDAAGRAHGLGFRIPSVHAGSRAAAAAREEAARIVERLDPGTGVGFLSFRLREEGPSQDRRPLATLIEAHFDLGGDLLVDRFLPAALGHSGSGGGGGPQGGNGFDLVRESVRVLCGGALPAAPPEPVPTTLSFVAGPGLERLDPAGLRTGGAKPWTVETGLFPDGGEAVGGRAFVLATHERSEDALEYSLRLAGEAPRAPARAA